MSIEMQDAYAKDMAVLKENGDYEYVDNPMEDKKTTIEVAEELEENTKKKAKKLDDIE